MADAQNKNTKDQQQDLNQILKVRREKLAALQEAGKDPFVHVKYDVTAHSADVREKFEELLQHSGFKGQHSGLCGKGQHRRGALCGFQKI